MFEICLQRVQFVPVVKLCFKILHKKASFIYFDAFILLSILNKKHCVSLSIRICITQNDVRSKTWNGWKLSRYIWSI